MDLDRRSHRLRGYDYRRPDPYYFTACTQNRACMFGRVREGVMYLNAWGRIVNDCWLALPEHFSHVVLDAFTVMPNHVHGVFWIVDGRINGPLSVGMTHASSLQDRILHARTSDSPPMPARGPLPGSAGTVIGSFKSAAARLINRSRNRPGAAVWQYNFHERIVRTQSALERIRRYIEENPRNWHRDRFHPRAAGG